MRKQDQQAEAECRERNQKSVWGAPAGEQPKRSKQSGPYTAEIAGLQLDRPSGPYNRGRNRNEPPGRRRVYAQPAQLRQRQRAHSKASRAPPISGDVLSGVGCSSSLQQIILQGYPIPWRCIASYPTIDATICQSSPVSPLLSAQHVAEMSNVTAIIYREQHE